MSNETKDINPQDPAEITDEAAEATTVRRGLFRRTMVIKTGRRKSLAMRIKIRRSMVGRPGR